ncbi:metal-binding protein [Exiguobacterium flavidum]|uniref:metal-binding protein n=1 Tax=Exiguobacterium flavidum TaxID=2184695 RepID=UPI000DF8213F|nr:metal-binding protein [Exiguobacterium flavidum]
MPSGNVHDTVNTIVLSGYVAYAVASDQPEWFPAAVGIAVGTLWLSPDLDLKSEPYYRWGPFRVLWIPYVKAMPHRSIWSHGLLIGDVIRLLYFFALLFPFIFFGMYAEVIHAADLDRYIEQLPQFMTGVVVASTIHILLDHLSSIKRTKRRRAR